MTNEKIIAQLKDMQSRCTNGYDAEALYLAIKTLEENDYRDGYMHLDDLLKHDDECYVRFKGGTK